jgi:hypothetical protein
MSRVRHFVLWLVLYVAILGGLFGAFEFLLDLSLGDGFRGGLWNGLAFLATIVAADCTARHLLDRDS